MPTKRDQMWRNLIRLLNGPIFSQLSHLRQCISDLWLQSSIKSNSQLVNYKVPLIHLCVCLERRDHRLSRAEQKLSFPAFQKGFVVSKQTSFLQTPESQGELFEECEYFSWLYAILIISEWSMTCVFNAMIQESAPSRGGHRARIVALWGWG